MRNSTLTRPTDEEEDNGLIPIDQSFEQHFVVPSQKDPLAFYKELLNHPNALVRRGAAMLLGKTLEPAI